MLYLILILMFTHFGLSAQAVLVLNMENKAALPARFRTAQDKGKCSSDLSQKGLDRLLASGSGQFSEKSFEVILKTLGYPQKLYVLDLREEAHGFLNGAAVSWYGARNRLNTGKNSSQIISEEIRLLQEAAKKKEVMVCKITHKNSAENQLPSGKEIPFLVKEAQTESAFLDAKKVAYLRLPVTDHQRPSDQIVEEFISWIRRIPAGGWVHIHCAGGSGRTTTFMVMLDMIQNASQISFDTIIRRQMCLGGAELHPEEKMEWKRADAAARYQFLSDFYVYVREVGPSLSEGWLSWLARSPGSSGTNK